MSKATIALSVKADTSSARKSLQELDKEVSKMQQQARSRNKKDSKDGASLLGLDFSSLKSKGLDAISKSLKEIPVAGDLASKAFKGLGSACTGLTAALASGVSIVAKMTSGLWDWVDIGSKSSEEFRKINTSLSTLAKNLGSTVSTKGLTQDIQWLAAEGVGNIDQLTQAAKTLLVAFDGNQATVKHWLSIMDDVAAGTSLTADQFASMTARVQASGKVETEVLNMLRDRGVPVYQMLAEEMGVTSEQALKLTQNGQVGMKEWMAVVEKMHESFKGLSAELSTNTLEGARATYEAARSLAYKGAADAADAQEIARLNAKSAQFKIDAFDQELQTELAAAAAIVGKVRGVWNSFWEDVSDFWALATRTVAKFTNWLGNAGDIVAENLVTAAHPFERIPDFAGKSSKQIGDYLTEISDLYKQMQGLIDADTDMEAETSLRLRSSMERIKANIERAEKASAEALETEQRIKEEETRALREAEAAAKAKAEADKEAARQARQEAAERKRSEEAIKKERLERLKNVKDYAKSLAIDEARDEADTAADSGDLDQVNAAADKMAQAAGALSMLDLESQLTALTDKIKNNPEEVSQEDLDRHKELSAIMQEVSGLRQDAEKSRLDAEARAQEELKRQDELNQRLLDEAQKKQDEAQETARRKSTDDKSDLDKASAQDLAEAAAQYRQELLDAGFALEEAQKLFDTWVAQQIDKAQDHLTSDTVLRDKNGKRILADQEMKDSLKDLARQSRAGDRQARREAAAQLKETREANKLAREQIKTLAKLNFEAKAL